MVNLGVTIMRSKASGLIAILLIFGLSAGAAMAAAGGGDRSSSSSSKPRNNDLTRAASMVESGNYDQAIPLLEKALTADPQSADAYNYLGYSLRKLGRIDQAEGFYQKALAIDPDHLGANEYLGELYLETGNLAKAEERLNVLDGACFFGCDAYYELRDAIAAYKAKQSS